MEIFSALKKKIVISVRQWPQCWQLETEDVSGGGGGWLADNRVEVWLISFK